jgi:hypothetical protein
MLDSVFFSIFSNYFYKILTVSPVMHLFGSSIRATPLFASLLHSGSTWKELTQFFCLKNSLGEPYGTAFFFLGSLGLLTQTLQLFYVYSNFQECMSF